MQHCMNITPVIQGAAGQTIQSCGLYKYNEPGQIYLIEQYMFSLTNKVADTMFLIVVVAKQVFNSENSITKLTGNVLIW